MHHNIMLRSYRNPISLSSVSKCRSRGGQGVRTPPGKSQVIWVSIGNKQLDTPPPPPWKKLDPPPPPGKCWTPSGTLKNDRLLWNWPFDFCQISWGLKKKKKTLSELFCQTDLDPPDENSWIRAWWAIFCHLLKGAPMGFPHLLVSMSVSYYSKTCRKQPLKKKTKIGFQDPLSLNAGQKYCRMLQGEHSAILSTFIKIPFVFSTFVLPFLSGRLRQVLLYKDQYYIWFKVWIWMILEILGLIWTDWSGAYPWGSQWFLRY